MEFCDNFVSKTKFIEYESNINYNNYIRFLKRGLSEIFGLDNYNLMFGGE